MRSRLFEIIYLLLDKPGTTAQQLADKFEVSVRTIYRDIDALSVAGIPVYAKKGKNGGIFLMEGYTLDKALLSQDERDDIIMGLQSLGATGYGNEALEKLGALFRQDESWISVDFTGWGEQERGKFDMLKYAVRHSRVVEFDYHSSYGGSGHRAAEPMQLVFKGRAWYVSAYCRRREGFRLFKLSRMRNVTVMDEVFERRIDEENSGFETLRPENYVEITLRIAPGLAYRVYDEFGADMIEKEEDGSFVARSSMPEDEWVYGYILSFGAAAEVLHPPHIREIISKRLKKALALYEKGD